MGLLFVGVPALDTCLVIVSRRRRGLSILTAGRDHLTHRARQRLQTARAVAITLGGAQAVVSACDRGHPRKLRGRRGRRRCLPGQRRRGNCPSRHPAGRSAAAGDLIRGRAKCSAPHRATRRNAVIALLVCLGVGIGISPFFFGFYDAGIWVPIGLGVVGRPNRRLHCRAPAARRLSGSCPCRLGVARVVGACFEPLGGLGRAGGGGRQSADSSTWRCSAQWSFSPGRTAPARG